MVIGICVHVFVLFNDTATTEIYTYGHTLALHDALPISARIRAGVHPAPHRQCAGGDGRHHRAHGCADDPVLHARPVRGAGRAAGGGDLRYFAGGVAMRRLMLAAMLMAATPGQAERSEEHTSELQSLMRISYAVFCLKKKQ